MRMDPILMLLIAVLLVILGFLAGCDWTMTSYLDDLEGVTDLDQLARDSRHTARIGGARGTDRLHGIDALRPVRAGASAGRSAGRDAAGHGGGIPTGTG